LHKVDAVFADLCLAKKNQTWAPGTKVNTHFAQICTDIALPKSFDFPIDGFIKLSELSPAIVGHDSSI